MLLACVVPQESLKQRSLPPRSSKPAKPRTESLVDRLFSGRPFSLGRQIELNLVLK